MTHGERWEASLAKRLDGYCRSRGWRHSGLIKVAGGERARDFELDVRDLLGNRATIGVQLYASEAAFLDDYGRVIENVNAATFDELTAHLMRPSKPSKRQLALPL